MQLHASCSAGEAVGAPDADMANLRKKHKQLHDYEKLKKLHWDVQSQSFADWGLHTEELIRVRKASTEVLGSAAARCFSTPIGMLARSKDKSHCMHDCHLYSTAIQSCCKSLHQELCLAASFRGMSIVHRCGVKHHPLTAIR
jgi:DNA-binding ferritin-like protein